MSIASLFFQTAFALNFVNCLLVCWTLCKLIHLVPGLGDKRKRHGYSIMASTLCFKWLMLKPCPWLRIRGLAELEQAWVEMGKEEDAPFTIANHNSKLDSLMWTALLPLWLGPRMRSLIKLALFNEPLFGGICSAVGHFPVYFKGSAQGDFGVDKQAQAQVAKSMDTFLSSGGGLMIFPEGQLNKAPTTLQTFRRGAFALPIAHKKAIWGLINVGCEKAWPYNCVMGGFATEIYVRAVKVTDDASKYDTTSLAEHARQVMQQHVDEMYSCMKNNKAN